MPAPMIFEPPRGLTFETLYIAVIVLSCVVGIETAIIGSLLMRFGSPRRLWRIVFMSNQCHKKTAKEKDITNNHIYD